MVSGTFVLTDTIKAGFNGLFTTVYQNADAVISGKSATGGAAEQQPGLLPAFPESPALARARAPRRRRRGRQRRLPDAPRRPQRQGHLGFGGGGLGFGIDPSRGNDRLNPLKLVAGTWPTNAGEIAIDTHTASTKHYSLGAADRRDGRRQARALPDRRHRQARQPRRSAGRRSPSSTSRPGRRSSTRKGELDAIDVSSKAGVTPQQIVDQIRADPAADCRGPHRRSSRRRRTPRTRASSRRSSRTSCSRSPASRSSSAAS